MDDQKTSKTEGLRGRRAPRKQRVNVSIDPEVLDMGRKLARADGRSFSGLLEMLVRDLDRRMGGAA